ncbi:type VI secretion system protein TssA [Halomonas sp. MCCC 1A17488]|uniref:Type VI secretion system protein TssA n=1 Tax=Billgrantia sulfidoxydans TaxID=2733484 RepID=A0ABX7VXY4_9GAMM|nr:MULTISPECIES: type VI secretion system protein TssA [Halomonas]MCE8017128.1 type VI secretion system protein TssA [Halomonas sp. MCCC 1A17488]MCG3240461.1 type VI secretion system protein TssA [Halomonas sp. MCCC 1A17488]QPP49679.1 type VI secretion system protein TssA [Halomonas sp. SS10-MC5]QTP53289.1 type VI secretion system protein TssA [Halomonas sulfidoxydans]
MRIVNQTQLTEVLAALPPEGVGRPLDDSADYAWLDEQMMKIGSLQHGGVDWEGAETRAVRLLSTTGKDLKVLGHLLHCLQRGGDGVRFALSLRLLAGSLEQWWDQAYPYGGAQGERLRPRLFRQFTQRALGLAETLDFDNAADEHQACEVALEALLEAARTRELPDEALIDLQRQLRQARPSRDAAHASPATCSAPAQECQTDSATSPPAKLPEMRLEAGNERGNRQALLKMADFLGEQNPGDPLGYRLRRHAIWHVIQVLPATRDGVRSELAPPSADRVAEYREALSRGGDAALWQRIENSLAVSPYWLEGHRISAGVAERLGHPRCAAAIRDEASRFVERLPGIEALTFNDGSPFVDDETRHWLQAVRAGATAGGQAGGGDPWQEGLDEARERLAAEGLEAALAGLDRGLAEARSPREVAYWRLASADLLGDAGLAALAAQHYRAVRASLAGLGLEQWEPALLERLERTVEKGK